MPSRRRRRAPEEFATPQEQPARISMTSLLLVGLLIGLGIGLYYAWVVEPVVFVDASPARLSDSYKEEYLFLVSQNYAITSNWEQAQERLAALDDPQLPETVNVLLERYLREQKPPQVVENLAALAQKLGAEGSAVALFAPTPLNGQAAPPTPTLTPTPLSAEIATPLPTNTPTRTPVPTLTPSATPVPSPTTQPVYRLLNQERVCDETAVSPQIEVITYDTLLNELPGVEVLVSWEDGTDTFFTGFKPALGAGYGDFTMQPDISYSVQLADGSPEVSGLRIEPCDGDTIGGWRLTFQNLRYTLPETSDQ
ncbi:MAG: hypothetical protein H6662_03410 [Ardenticatenaceae bacterium]|nr:hypothetical protein [Ardenticatenaceae bacterium]MCB8990233.1 hypothetical protein [Ardenticatenaceae bacterium]MCB9002975.1 hypothetical protein [Ardenticatenaceae bacterium]